MDDVIPKDKDVTSRELSPSNLLETGRTSAEERVVLLAAVESYNCPHTVLVGVEGHSWSPRNMKHRQVWGIVQGGDPATFDGSERTLESAAIGDQLPKDVPHRHGRCVLVQRFSASCDDVLYEEFHNLRIRPLPDPPSKDTQTAFLTYAFDYNPPQVPSIESLGTDMAGQTASGSPSWLRQRSARNWKGLLKVWFPLNVELNARAESL